MILWVDGKVKIIATEERLIDANALLKKIEEEYDLNYGEILIDPRLFAEMVEDAPTVTTK